MVSSSPHCLRLLAHCPFKAVAFSLARAGSNNAARMAMIAITTNNSISVKPPLRTFALVKKCAIIRSCKGLSPQVFWGNFAVSGFERQDNSTVQTVNDELGMNLGNSQIKVRRLPTGPAAFSGISFEKHRKSRTIH